MAKKYKYYYAAEIVNVVASGGLDPIAPSELHYIIDKFESGLVDLSFQNYLESLDNDARVKIDLYKETIIDKRNKNIENASLQEEPAPHSLALNIKEDPPAPAPQPKPDPQPSPDPYDPSKAIVAGPAWFYSGGHFDSTFLGIGTRFKDLGLLRDEDLKLLRNKVTKRRYRLFSSLASNEIMSEARFSIQPSNKEMIMEPYGKLYETGVPYASRLPFSKIRSVIENWTFNFTVGEQQYKYVVVPGSVKIKRSRKYNPL